MLNGISSFFFGSAVQEIDGTQEVRLRVTHVDDEWALVDRTNCAFSCLTTDGNCPCSRYNHLVNSDPSPNNPAEWRAADPSSHNPAEWRAKCRRITNSGRALDRVVSPGAMDESWLVEPPSCFTAGGRSQSPLSNPMENLLIEHPSMSVYNSRGRPSSTGTGSVASSSSGDENSPVTRSRTLVVKSAPRRPRAVSVRAGLIPQRELVKTLQKTKRKIASKHHTRNHLERHNKTSIKTDNLRSLDRHQVRVQQPKKNC